MIVFLSSTWHMHFPRKPLQNGLQKKSIFVFLELSIEMSIRHEHSIYLIVTCYKNRTFPLFFLSQYLFFSKYIKFKQSGEIMLICYKNIISWHTSYVFTIKFISKTKSAKMMIASLHIFMKSDVSFRNSCTFILNDFRMTMKNILP